MAILKQKTELNIFNFKFKIWGMEGVNYTSPWDWLEILIISYLVQMNF